MEFLQDPAFWAAVAFVIFIAATAKPISRLLTAGLDKRADKIRSDLEEAEKLREEAQDLLASYQRKQRDALAEAEAIIAHAGEEAERLAVQERDKLEAALERRQKQAIDRIAQAEAQALDLVRAKTVDVALDATRDYLAKELKDNQSDALTDAAIKDLPGNLH
ncbi:MAG: ATP synthase subunit b [Alphaproteobacteria bacterium MarineAlpha3_Bin2]|jgi:F-type H+-transporting ATPase subunit b|nr:MAG: ATP synthase subunit b [Alphaproteobacteria bacterium MarineAlpha3_Bin2]